MCRFLLRPGLAPCLLLACLSGCRSTPAEHGYPNDPLLISKRPVERRAENAAPVAMVRGEPQVPPLPGEDMVTRAGPAASYRGKIDFPPDR